MVHSFIHSFPSCVSGLPHAGQCLSSQTHHPICTREPGRSHASVTVPEVSVLTEVNPGFLGVRQTVAPACLGCGVGVVAGTGAQTEPRRAGRAAAAPCSALRRGDTSAPAPHGSLS